MTPRGYRPRRSESGLLWVAERIPPPELWLPETLRVGFSAGFNPPEQIRARDLIGFVLTIGPVHVDAEQYDRLFYGDQEARTSSIFLDRPDPLDDVASMGDTLAEIQALPETLA